MKRSLIEEEIHGSPFLCSVEQAVTPGTLTGPDLSHLASVLRAAAPWLALACLAGAAVCTSWRLRQRRQVRAALAARVAFDLVPTPTFAPKESEVVRYASQLGRARHAANRVPRRGAAVRLHLTTVDGRLRYRVEGPAEAAAVLRMSGYAEVEVRSAGTARQSLPPVRFTGPSGAAR